MSTCLMLKSHSPKLLIQIAMSRDSFPLSEDEGEEEIVLDEPQTELLPDSMPKNARLGIK